MVCCQQAREPTASHDGIGRSLHPGHPGFALQQPRWRLPWSAVVELVADIGQRDPGSRDVVANVQICRVDEIFGCQKSAKAKSQAPSAISPRTITVASRVSSVSTLRARRWCESERWAMVTPFRQCPISLKRPTPTLFPLLRNGFIARRCSTPPAHSAGSYLFR